MVTGRFPYPPGAASKCTAESPISLQLRSSRFARWSGEFIHIVTAPDGVTSGEAHSRFSPMVQNLHPAEGYQRAIRFENAEWSNDSCAKEPSPPSSLSCSDTAA